MNTSLQLRTTLKVHTSFLYGQLRPLMRLYHSPASSSARSCFFPFHRHDLVNSLLTNHCFSLLLGSPDLQQYLQGTKETDTELELGVWIVYYLHRNKDTITGGRDDCYMGPTGVQPAKQRPILSSLYSTNPWGYHQPLEGKLTTINIFYPGRESGSFWQK